ncbi:MAG: type I restriction-modification system subunit M [Bacillota bacterium]|jgi:type I restriction enzyme M protein|nr:type I restriction-modification system subunit M [Bacillota bacterium]
MITSEAIKRRLWDGANELRGSMDASRYKDYMLGLMFYKFLSDKTLDTFKSTAGLNHLSDEELVKEYQEARAEYGDQLDKMIQKVLGYYVAPEYLYQTWIIDINSGEFEVQKVTDSLNNFERTISVSGDSSDFKGLFSSSTLDLSDTALGSNLNERSKNIKALILLFADLNMIDLQKGDVLGDAYEYLIGQFAMESGKKAGEFYTPRQVSEVMAQIVAKSSSISSIYDPTVGSGSLLLTVGRHLDEDSRKNLDYYGQEKNTSTYNLSRMNLLLHGVRPDRMTIKNGDTLAEDWPEDPERPNEGVLFDAVVMNPPYSLKNWNRSEIKVNDPRFEIAGVLPPNSKGDYAFLLHGLFHLGTQGTMAIVLPHGVLFRGAAEGEIRKRLLEKNYIDTIIGLPSNMFTNTGIPVVVMILKKNRELTEPILIIDASKDFTKIGKQNVLLEKDIAKIVDTYVERRTQDGYSHLANREETLENDYNLNIPRYVMSMEEEIPHDVDAHIYGGIPQTNINDLKILKAMVPDVLEDSLKEIHEGYVELVKPIDELTDDILNNKRVVEKTNHIISLTEQFIQKYWDRLRLVNKDSNLNKLMNTMLVEIKQILSGFNYVDTYDGYQIVADIWNDSLINDLEIIANADFYTAGRMREPNMVTRGSGKNKREEQDGWEGSIIPTDLIAKELYAEQLAEIEEMKSRLQEIESELSEMVDLAKDEDSEESEYLFEAVRKNSEGEPGTSFENRAVKTELNKYSKDEIGYELLSKVDSLLSERTKLTRNTRTSEKDLNDKVQERILELTDAEIDQLVYQKWFGEIVDSMIKLSQDPLLADLDTLKLLAERYEDTLDDIDQEMRELEMAFEELASQLVVLK